MSISSNFLDSALDQFSTYKSLAERTFSQLSEEEMHFQPNPEVNSVAINIQHMNGNMLSRWTNFLTEDGEKDWRKRDEEFEKKNLTKDQLLLLWEEGWRTLFEALRPLGKKDLKEVITIRGKELTVVEAVNRQLTHYSYHVGQIVMLGKLIRGNDWQNLSIPRGESAKYNQGNQPTNASV